MYLRAHQRVRRRRRDSGGSSACEQQWQKQLNLSKIHSRNSQLVEMFALIYVRFTAEIAR